ncbi:hypothetical protein M9M90_02535 [Phenylobacterium sp. LH3H17]|uniref:hypothetical protein n=1 Tax=Phenylobacterium sp. LH3H17 TaxID=2903901 RepID=UPI0020C946BD|nr:hypothetical protein [Phenylobacterium sp. LH3H17]UTP40070.1 hypothetical protein M9M90_02535 [Phenylobacterium sp. LH3H17]
MRVAVVGSSGSGKSTFTRRLGAARGLTVIELDAINWQAGWRDLNTHDPETFVRRVEAAVAGDAWVTDGNYSRVLPTILARATHIVWLDYGRGVIMSRVLRRSFQRSLSRKEVWPGTGNVETWASWLDKEHPIRWAWDTFARRRARYVEAFADDRLSHLTIHRLRHPREAQPLIARLAREAVA